MAEIPEWAAKKAAELMNAEAGNSAWHAREVNSFSAFRAFARYIAEHETAPVDPDVLAVREILAEASPSETVAAEFFDGERDGDMAFALAVSAYRRHASKRNG